MDAVNERRLSRIREECELYLGLEMGLLAAPGEMTSIHLGPVRNFIRRDKRTIECVESGEPLLASAFNNPAEILTAMDVHWYFLFAQAFAGGFENPHIQEDLEALDKMPVPGDCCSLIRLGLRYLDAGLLPLPAAYLGVTEPCDGIIGVHEALRTHPEWRGVPSFGIDVPYWDDEHAVDYVAGQLRRMVEFITKHTGKTLDINRLREVVTESNEQYRLWQEYNELRRSKPSPHNYVLAQACFLMTNFEGAGRPDHTVWFRELVADAERRVRLNQPEVPNQRIRVLWFDLQPIYFDLIAPWLEQEWGASVVMDMVSYCPYKLIDTSTEESMFRGLARRLISDPPMIRQARGLADNFLADINRIVRDYQIDCVIWPGHIGHKDGAASVSLMRELCRDMNVPFLHVGMDQFDRRYTSPELIKERVSHFFTATGLGDGRTRG